MTIKMCEECNLPLNICSALTMYRRAAMLFERGRTEQVMDCIESAKGFERAYDKQRGALISE